MAEELLGPSFEIHGGGLDLVFPHHENELAQSRALGHRFAQIWAHNGLLRFTGEKMSKSVGNIATLREALDEWGREALLVFFLGGHWRKPIDFSDETMAQAQAQAETLPQRVPRSRSEPAAGDWDGFADALEDDFNTPEALAVHARVGANGSSTCCAGRSSSSASSRWPSRSRAPAEIVELAEQRAEARARGRRLRGGRPAAGRDRGGRLGDARRAAAATRSSAKR